MYAFKESLIMIICLFVLGCVQYFLLVVSCHSTGTPQAVYYSLQLQAVSFESEMEKRPLGKLRSTKPSPPD